MSESTVRGEERRLVQLEAEATHARERFDLYKAKVYGSGHSSPSKLRNLKQASEYAEARLKRARADA
jgi:hypothetical protein